MFFYINYLLKYFLFLVNLEVSMCIFSLDQLFFYDAKEKTVMKLQVKEFHLKILMILHSFYPGYIIIPNF
jgi:hypothetical protein